MMEKGDKDGNTTLLKMWFEAGDDFYGYVARDQRLVEIARQLIAKRHLPVQPQDDDEGAAQKAEPGSGTRTTATGTRTSAWRPRC